MGDNRNFLLLKHLKNFILHFYNMKVILFYQFLKRKAYK